MNKFVPVALLATVTLFALTPVALRAEEATVSASAGQAMYGPKGKRVAAVYRVTSEGAVQIILDGKLITVPNSTLSEVDGKLTTTLTRSELRRAGR